jgi:hypothetical protein
LTGNLTPALIGKLMDGYSNLFMSLRPLPPEGAANNPFGLRFYNLILTPPRLAPDWLRGASPAHSAATAKGSRAADALLSLPSDLATKIATNPPRIYRMYFGTE